MSLTYRLAVFSTVLATSLLTNDALADPLADDAYREQRATVLARYLEPSADSSASDYTGYALGGVSSALTVGAIALIATSEQPFGADMAGAWVGTIGIGITAIGGFVSYAPDEDYYLPALGISTDIGLGTSYTGLSLMMNNASERAFAIGAAAHFARAGLRIVDMSMVRPISRARLAKHYRSIRTPDKRASISEEQLAKIESDFARRQGALSPWLLHAPLMVGGAGTLALMADQNLTGSERALIGIQGGSLLLHGAVSALASMGGGYDAYESELDDRGFQIGIAPGPGAGLALVGTF
jgi:hypothetical protein